MFVPVGLVRRSAPTMVVRMNQMMDAQDEAGTGG